MWYNYNVYIQAVSFSTSCIVNVTSRPARRILPISFHSIYSYWAVSHHLLGDPLFFFYFLRRNFMRCISVFDFLALWWRPNSKCVIPRGWYARSIFLPSWGCHCVLIITGGGSTYAPGRRQSPPSPTRFTGLASRYMGALNYSIRLCRSNPAYSLFQ